MQPLVATSTSTVSRKIDLITSCLRGYPEGLSPKLIALKTGLNLNTVKSLLPKISYVKKVMRGLYKDISKGDGTCLSDASFSSWSFHNCILSGPCDNSFTASYLFGPVRFDVTAVGGKATGRLSCDFPLCVSSLCFVAGFFSDKVGCCLDEVFVSSVEFNKDFVGLRLDGLRSVSVLGLFEQFKVYQKSCGLRVERKTSVPFSVSDLSSLLSSKPLSLDFEVELARQSDAIRRLLDSSRVNYELLNRFLDKQVVR